MNAGVATIDITPDRPICMAGYAARPSHSQGTYHKLCAKALYVEDGNERAVLLATDVIGFDHATCDLVKTGIGNAMDLAPKNIMLTATHTHTGPEMRIEGHKYIDEFDHEYALELVGKCVEAAVQAAKTPEPVTLRFGSVSCTLGVNRRLPTPNGIAMRPNPHGLTDPDASVASFDRADGSPLAILMLYACHPTTLGGYLIGGDYPGFAQDYVEEAFPGTTAMFILGCAGDQKVRHVDGKGGFRSGPYEVARSLGHELGRAVLLALGGATEPVSGALRTRMTEIELPFQGPPEREEAARMAEHSDRHLAAWGKKMLEMLDTGAEFPTGRPFTIQTFEFGELALPAMAGEVCVGYALRLKEELAPRPVMIAAYANGMIGYIPTAAMLPEGGYEAGRSHYYNMFPSPYAAEAEDAICEEIHRLLS